MRRPPRVLALLCALTTLSLHAQPVAPTPEQVARLHALAVTLHPLAVSTPPLSVNVSAREEVRQFYRSIYNTSEGIPMAWTGNYTATDPIVAAGDTSAAFKEAVRLRINFFRALVGVPAAITLNSTYSTKDQQAALMMSANNALNHFPPNTWTFYTADGATAAGNSNLAIGYAGPDAISGYMSDSGSNNAAVGHRRWLYYPQTLQMGTGDVPGTATLYPANVTWVVDDQFGGTRPATRTTQITYPPAGYVPYQLVWPRWSFSYPGADFSAASVTMTRNSQSVAVAPEVVSTGAGENAFVWVYDGLPSSSGAPHPKPTADTIYSVSVNNVKIGSSTQNFSYNVTVFDPDVTGGDYMQTTVSIPATLSVGQATSYTVAAPAFASYYEFRSLQFVTFTKSYNAESGLNGIVALTENYPTVVTDTVGAGMASYHLAMPDTSIAIQTLTLPETFYAPNSSASLTFLSRLGWASAQQTAHVQLALDDGTAWFDVMAQTGTDGAGEASFTTRTVSLSAYAGRTFHVRFAYTYANTGSGSYYPQTSAGVGWYLNNIALTGVQTTTAGSSSINPVGTGGTYTAAATGSVIVQARGLFFGTYPMEWGTVAAITVNAGPPITTQPQAQTIATGSTVVFSVAATGNGLTYQWAKDGVALPGATAAFLLVANAQATDAGNYTVTISNGTALTTSTAATLTVLATTTPGRLVNLSTRGQVGTGGNVLIAGFVITGSASKPVIIRGVGPTLTNYGVTGTLPDPLLTLQLTSNGSVVSQNDNWATAGTPATVIADMARVGAFALPTGSLDSVISTTLAPGTYTATLSGNGATNTGVGIVEIYDATVTLDNTSPRLVNISTRGVVGTGASVMIPGFVITGATAKTVLIRCVGPTLANYGVTGTLADPIIYLNDSHGTVINQNDNWGTAGDAALITSAAQTTGAFALAAGSKDSALLITLPAGSYTVTVNGVNATTGVALVEVYELP